jgi:predicted alpha/beta-hydrolase family hydrolase
VISTEELFDSGGVHGVLHRPAAGSETGNAFALTHGASSNHTAPVLTAITRALAEAGNLALRYDLPYRQLRPRGSPFPAGAARDREGIAAAVSALRSLVSGKVFAGGHSYGGRQTTMAAAENAGLADGLILFSYPLHPPGKPDRLRTEHFPNLQTRALFVQGTKDGFGSIDEMRGALALIPAHTELLPVEGGGHDLKRAASMGTEILARFHALLCYSVK